MMHHTVKEAAQRWDCQRGRRKTPGRDEAQADTWPPTGSESKTQSSRMDRSMSAWRFTGASACVDLPTP